MNTDHLHWRYAVKKFNPSKTVSETDLANLLETLRLSPSSFGLQPWKFLVIQDPDLRKKIQPLAWNQPQTVECSHLIVLCRLTEMTEAHIQDFIRQTAAVQGVTEEKLAPYKQMILNFIAALNPEAKTQWMKLQVYLALGMLLSECAHQKIDACPMEGFDAKKLDELLGLAQKGLQSVVLCPIGYRDPSDKYAAFSKVRRSAQDVLIRL